MKRLLFAAIVAVMIHGFIFSLQRKPTTLKSPIKSKAFTVKMATIKKKAAPVHPLKQPLKKSPAIKTFTSRPISALKLNTVTPPRSLPLPTKPSMPPKPAPPARPSATAPVSKIKPAKKNLKPPAPDPTPPPAATKPVERITQPSPAVAKRPSQAEPVKNTIKPIVKKIESPGQAVSAISIPPPKSTPKMTRPITKKPPVCRQCPVSPYPLIAKKRGYQGTVWVIARVNIDGQIDALRVLKSSGYAILDKAALAQVKPWLFEPGRLGDKAVATNLEIPIQFKLK
jgi:periplasmic protein TonB